MTSKKGRFASFSTPHPVVGRIHFLNVFLTISLILTHILSSSHVHALCPARCTCHEDRLTVECREAFLDVVPITLNPSIHELFLEKNNIKTISSSLNFYRRLSILDLSYNQISSVGPGDFSSQQVLSVLLLSHNRVSSILKGAFSGLSNLKVLSLSYNNLKSIQEFSFSKLVNLERLDLSRNHLLSENIHVKSFDDVGSLRVLHLEGNKLSFLSRDFSLKNVTDLHLAHNHFGSILRNYSFTSTPSLVSLSLEGNQIDTIEAYAFYSVNDTLEILDLSSNLFDTIPSTALSILGKLHKLSLNRNRLVVLGEDAFRGLANLRSFSLKNDDNLRSVDVKTFSSNVFLEDVAIDFCPNLQSLSPETFVLQRESLRRVSLRGNGFSTLHPLLLDWSRMESLDIRGNPFNCSSCDIKWVWDFVNTRRRIVSEHKHDSDVSDDTREILCQEPLSQRGHEVTSLSLENLNCLQESLLMQEDEFGGKSAPGTSSSSSSGSGGGGSASSSHAIVPVIGAALGALLSSIAVIFLLVMRRRRDKRQTQVRLKEYFSNHMQPYFSTTTYSAVTESRQEEEQELDRLRRLKMTATSYVSENGNNFDDNNSYLTNSTRSTRMSVINNPYERVIYESSSFPIYQELDSPPNHPPPPAPLDVSLPRTSQSSGHQLLPIISSPATSSSRTMLARGPQTRGVNNNKKNNSNNNINLNGINNLIKNNGMTLHSSMDSSDVMQLSPLESIRRGRGGERTTTSFSSRGSMSSSSSTNTQSTTSSPNYHSSSIVIQHPIKLDSNLYRL